MQFRLFLGVGLGPKKQMPLANALYKFLGASGYLHPVHPAIVHMPIGLIVGAVILAYAAPFLPKLPLRRAAYYCLVLAFIFYFPTVFWGYLDWQYFFSGGWIFYIEMKLTLAAILLVLLSVGLFLGRKPGQYGKSLNVIYGLAFLNVVGLGYFGGQLVYAGKTPTAPAQYTAGQNLFDNNCASCHPQGGNILDPNRPVMGAPQLASHNAFVAWLRSPKLPGEKNSVMPPFPTSSITDSQAEDIRQYIINVLEKSRTNSSAAPKK